MSNFTLMPTNFSANFCLQAPKRSRQGVIRGYSRPPSCQ